MDITEAYYFTMDKVKELRDGGIDVLIKSSSSKNNPDTVKKYNRPDRISPDLWHHVSFQISDLEQYQKIHEAANYLGLCGIGFDTGCGCGSSDWELDWSFRYKKGEEDWDWRDAREDVKDMAENIFYKKTDPEKKEESRDLCEQ